MQKYRPEFAGSKLGTKFLPMTLCSQVVLPWHRPDKFQARRLTVTSAVRESSVYEIILLIYDTEIRLKFSGRISYVNYSLTQNNGLIEFKTRTKIYCA